jgi:hypothetical protein
MPVSWGKNHWDWGDFIGAFCGVKTIRGLMPSCGVKTIEGYYLIFGVKIM